MNRRDFLTLASKTLGLLGIAPIFGLPEATQKPELLPRGVLLENNAPVGIVTEVNGPTVTAKWFPGYDTPGTGDTLEYHGPSVTWGANNEYK